MKSMLNDGRRNGLMRDILSHARLFRYGQSVPRNWCDRAGCRGVARTTYKKEIAANSKVMFRDSSIDRC